MFPLFASFSAEKPPQELYKYLQKLDRTYESRVVSSDVSGVTVEMTSQTWENIPWKHTILIRQPKALATRGTGILYITGDGPRPGDYRDIGLVAEATGMPVAMLFDIPNQPLFEKKEDGLIALTVLQYLKTQDASWPLLFPMTKSALRAMDAVESATASTSNPIHRFVVTGASKRGWTTWLVGAAKDRRVVAIAPMVYDNLNVVPQMAHQLDSWGAYSEQIQDYTKAGIQQQLGTPAGKKLARMVDPYSYLGNIRIPTLIVKGANDPYWTADATDLYWTKLKQPHWLYTVPNAGHDLGGGVLAALTIGAFARSIAGEFTMPMPEGTVEATATNLIWTSNSPSTQAPEDPKLMQVGLWVAQSENLDFRKSAYHRVAQYDPFSIAPVKVSIPRPTNNLAVFMEFQYKSNGRTFNLSLPTKIIKK